MMFPNDCFCICDFETTGVDTEKDYPIEIGCLFTDSNFNVIEEYEAIISCPAVTTYLTNNHSTYDGWGNKFGPAYDIHNISVEEYTLNQKNINVILEDIHNIIEKINTTNKFDRFILLSDNIQFEWAFMKKLYKCSDNYVGQWPFHYCGWDSNLLLDVTKIGDPIAVHRALPDCKLIHSSIVEAIATV